MNVKKKILQKLKNKKYITIDELVKSTGLSKQAIHKHFKHLIKTGKIKKIGRTKGVKYTLRAKPASDLILKAERYYSLYNLKEDEVFEQLNIQYDLRHQLRRNVLDILRYSFTEVLNNAIEHSQSDKAKIKLELSSFNVKFIVDDWGMGIFENIKEKYDLENEHAALQELIKGKTTTAKRHHTGEGLFFTSKVADKLRIKSHKIQIIFDNIENDIFTEQVRHKKGTVVNFIISRNSKRKTENIFNKYGGEEHDYQFSKTSVMVNLFTNTKDYYVSRSEAKRLLYNLDKFKEIILDFKGVRGIGQGFADEIFRVFKNTHPEIKIQAINANEVIETMVKHVKKG